MSELSPIDTPKVNSRSEIVAPARQEYKFVGSIRVRPGHKLFCFNPAIMDISEVIYTRHVDVNLKGEPLKKAKVNYDPKCIYVAALNLQNAIKKINKMTGIGLKIVKPTK